MTEGSAAQSETDTKLPFMRSHRFLITSGAVLLFILFAAFYMVARVGLREWERVDRASIPKQTGLVLKMFANDSAAHVYPELSPVPGMLSIRNEQSTGKPVVPEYLSDPTYLLEQEAYRERYHDAKDPQVILDRSNYYYLGYAIGNEEEFDAFAAAYKLRTEKGLLFNEGLIVPQGKGNNGGDKIHRLAEGIGRIFITDVHNPEALLQAERRIPVLIERPHAANQKERYVLYLDGHVAREPYPGKWPVTARVMNILNSLENDAQKRK